MISQMIRTTLRSLLFGGVLLHGATFNFFVTPAAAQSLPGAARAQIEEVLNGLSRGRSIGQVAISPDGKRLAIPGS